MKRAVRKTPYLIVLCGRTVAYVSRDTWSKSDCASMIQAGSRICSKSREAHRARQTDCGQSCEGRDEPQMAPSASSRGFATGTRQDANAPTYAGFHRIAECRAR